MRFTKMQGTGNDFVVVDCLDRPVPADLGTLARRICDRRFGVGADGLVFVLRGKGPAFRMEIWNSDGSQAAMCGNAARCIGVWLAEHGGVGETRIPLETASGEKILSMLAAPDGTLTVEVDMGAARWTDACLPSVSASSRILDYGLPVSGRDFRIHCVSMGNPHCVVYADELSDELVLGWGPLIEKHPFFPDRTNVEFVRVVSPSEVQVRVWERGCGETLACGTGASAVCAVSFALGLTGPEIDCVMPGGTLRLRQDVRRVPNTIQMSGPARTVFVGDYRLEGER